MGDSSLMNSSGKRWRIFFEALTALIFLPYGTSYRTIFDCTFEDPALCNFSQDLSDDLDWDLFFSPVRPSSYTDHTLGSGSDEVGHYARLYANGGDAGRAGITTPPLALTQGTAEVSFYYHMWDPEIGKNELFAGELNVYACNKRLVWTKSGNLGDVWYKATFRFECNGEFSLTFEGVLGKTTPDIAIDDVLITDCFNETTTLKPLTTIVRRNLTSTSNINVMNITTKAPLVPTSSGQSLGGNITEVLQNVTNSPTLTSAGSKQTVLTPTGTDVMASSGQPLPPDGDGVISEEVAVSLVVVAVFLFATTCLLLFLTIVLHCCKCCCNGNILPAHIIYHAPSYINPDARLAPEEYMHLNFNGRRASLSTTTGTEFLTLSERGGTNKSRDRSSFGSIGGSRPTSRLLGRRTSRTFPGVREIKSFLHDIHFRRLRTFSSHVTAAELAVVRRRLESAGRIHAHRNRTRSTILLERSGSTVRPVSEISEHFYYSLFPDASPEIVMDSDSNQSSLDLRVEVPARVGTIELLSHHDRAHRRRTNSSNLRIIWTSEGGMTSNTSQVAQQVTLQAQEHASEMVDNEIYESYKDDEVKC